MLTACTDSPPPGGAERDSKAAYEPSSLYLQRKRPHATQAYEGVAPASHSKEGPQTPREGAKSQNTQLRARGPGAPLDFL